MTAIVYDHRMTDAEALMWRLEQDPRLSSTFANVTILDRRPDFDLLRRRMERAAMRMPRLRQIVRPSPANLGPPVWVDDPDFDIDLHVRRIALPKPGSERQVLDLATLIAGDPFDRTRPLWQFVVVEGLKGNRAALIEKLHHTISDGEAGVRLSFEFLDFERDALEPTSSTVTEATPDDEAFVEDPSAVAVRELLNGALRVPLGVSRQVKELLADPAQIPDATNAAAETFRGIANQLGDTEPARSPLWSDRSARRRLEVATAPFAETRAAAKKLDGTLNTAFLTIAAEAAGRYHAELGAPVESLRASMAISTRTPESGANAFSLVRLLVPTGDLPIGERFRAVRDASRAALDEGSNTSLDTLAGLASMLPTSVVTRLARQQAQTVDFATSNVKGSPVPMFVAGAQLLNNYPVGPLSGVAFNLTLLSYVGNLDMGLNTDAAAVRHPEVLKRQVGDAIRRFVEV